MDRFESAINSAAVWFMLAIIIAFGIYAVRLMEKSIHLTPPWREYYLNFKHVALLAIYILIIVGGLVSNIEDLTVVLGVDALYSLGLIVGGLIFGDSITVMIGVLGIIIFLVYIVEDSIQALQF